MVEAIKVDTTVDRIRSKSKEDRTFALKLDNHFCPMTGDWHRTLISLYRKPLTSIMA